MMNSPSVCPGQTGGPPSLVCAEIEVGPVVRATSKAMAHTLAILIVVVFFTASYPVIQTGGYHTSNRAVPSALGRSKRPRRSAVTARARHYERVVGNSFPDHVNLRFATSKVRFASPSDMLVRLACPASTMQG